MTASQHDVPLREHSHLDLQQSGQIDGPPPDDRLCPGCKKSAVNEQGGLVVAFGQSFFHVDCFKCAKCRNQVTADTNLLLLSDGSPICANCSYSCNVCRLPILDEAIMAGDDSYHAHCFKCKVCKNRIDELVFAKTSQGIYCMKCHNERMIRIRKHTQKKAEREKAQGGSGSSKSREREARNFHRENMPPSSPGYEGQNQITPKPSSAQSQETPRRPEDPAPSFRKESGQYSAPLESANLNRPALGTTPLHSPVSTSGFPSNHNVSVTVAPPESSALSDRQNPVKQSTLPLPAPSRGNSRRSISYDDGLKPVEETRNSSELGVQPSTVSNSLSVTSRRDKRRSINPGLKLTPFSEMAPPSASAASLSPRTDVSPDPNTLTQQSYIESRGASPRPEQSSYHVNRTSHSSSLHSIHSLHSEHEISRSPSPSITTNDYDEQDDTVMLKSPIEANLVSNGISSNPGGPHGEKLSASLSPNDPIANFRSQQRLSSNSSLSYDTHRSGSRSASPAYRADVPRSVESGTDTDPESERDSMPPAPPPKDSRTTTKSPTERFESPDPDTSGSQELSDVEASEIERNSHSTFIAPAIPPMRFSVGTAGFSELLNSVNGKLLGNLVDVSPSQTSDSTPLPPADPAQSLTGFYETPSQPPTPTAESSSSHGDFSDSQSSRTNELKSSQSSTLTQIAVTPVAAPGQLPRQKSSGADIVTTRLREALENAKERGAQQLKLDRAFVEAIVQALDARTVEHTHMKAKFDGMKRASKHYIEGLTVAQTEYDRELKARRDAEAEVTRLRVLLSGQAARLTALSGDSRRQELRQQINKELGDSLSGLEHDLSRLKAERDMTLAEMEELSSAAKSSGGSSPEIAPTTLGRSLTKRLDTIRTQYQRELIPLTQQREQLTREIAELKGVRDVFLEETAVLNARNEELSQLSAVYSRRMDTISETPVKNGDANRSTVVEKSRSQQQGPPVAPSLSASTSSTSTIYEDPSDSRLLKATRVDQDMQTPAKNKFKWPGSKVKEMVSPTNGVEFSKGKAHIEHNFQQLSVLRFTRCDHCGDKMWGSQLRCTACSTSIHVRCIANVHIPCTNNTNTVKEEASNAPLPPSMFGRDLTEQVQADSKDGEVRIPVIVEKCIDAVEALALDYEGIYRKTGGSAQQRTITQLFERGDYSSFDLRDTDRFNDICSVTSVLKTYFRSLPIPLLTFDLHDQFISGVSVRDPAAKHQTLIELVDKLPDEHYYTLRRLMIHLHHVRLECEKNRMTSRNLGVVFGPTLMRSRDPGAEFSDMAGKALFIEWMIDNAPEIFRENH